MRSRALALAALVLLAGCLAAVAPAAVPVGTASAADAPTSTHHTVTSFDGTPLLITVHRPAGATAEDPVPIVLHSHGWSGSRAKAATGVVGTLVGKGYGVVSIDARGHGESGGQANVHNKDVEVHDFVAILDWMAANLDWAERDADDCAGDGRDLRLGAIGGSYGGGYQLMTASYDCRLDVLAPEITWNDLTYSLAPNGVVKTVWVDALYGAAKGTGTRVSSDIDRWYQEVMLENSIPSDAYDHFKGSSPLPSEIAADVLLVQGVPDVLFNLNEAVANYRALEGGVAGDVRLVTHLTGHILSTGLVPAPLPVKMGLQPEGTGVERGTTPCGATSDLVVAWMDEHLKGIGGAAAQIPEVALALEQGECLALDGFPDDVEEIAVGTVAVPQVGGSVLLPLAEGPRVVGGIGTFAATATSPLAAKFQVALVAVGADGDAWVVDDQPTAISVGAGTTALEVDLTGVATRLAEGDRLFLRVDAVNEWFATNSGRTPGGVLLEDVVVGLPVVPDA